MEENAFILMFNIYIWINFVNVFIFSVVPHYPEITYPEIPVLLKCFYSASILSLRSSDSE